MADIQELLLRISGDSHGGHEALKSFEDHLQELTGSLKTSILEGLGPYGAAAGVALAAATALGVGLMELGQHATETAAELQKVSLTTGIAVGPLADLKFAFEATGGSLDQLNGLMLKFEARIANSSESVDKGLKLIGLSLDEIGNMSHDQQILAISEAMQHAGDDTNRAAAAVDILGKQGLAALPQLMQPLGELAAKSRELGNVTAAAAEAAHEFEIGQKTMATEATLQWTKIGLTVAPATNAIAAGYERMKLAVANVAALAVDIGSGFGWLSAINDWEAGAEAEIPKVASSLKGLADQSGLAAKQLNDYMNGVKAFTPHVVTMDEALANTSEVQRDLDSETQKAIEAAKKHQEAVDALVDTLEGHNKKSGEMVEALQRVVKDGLVLGTDAAGRFKDEVKKLVDQGVDVPPMLVAMAAAADQAQAKLDLAAVMTKRLDEVTVNLMLHQQSLIPVYADWAAMLPQGGGEIEKLASHSLPSAGGAMTDFGAAILAADQKLKDSLKSFRHAPEDISLFDEAMAGIPKVLESVFAHGGSFETSIKALGSKLGGNLGRSIQESLYEQMGSSETGDSTLTKIFGDTIGGAFTAAIPALGALVGPLISKLFSIGGPSAAEQAGRKVEKAFEDGFGGFQGMMDAVGAAYAATGRSAQQAQADVKALMDAEKQGGQAATDAAAKIQQAFTDQTQDAADLTAAVQRYGFTLEELGPTMQRQQLDAQAKQLINDWRVLVDSGMNVVTVDEKMAKSMQDYLTQAHNTGQEVPAAMEPIIKKMIEQGDLTDANGDKITDMKQLGITFSETMTQGFDKVVSKLQELLNKIGMVPAALNNIPVNTNVDINLNGHWNIPDMPTVEGAATGGLVTSSGIRYLAAGGFIPRGTDTVPAMLTPGESVLTRAATSRLGPDVIGRLNRGMDFSKMATPSANIVFEKGAIDFSGSILRDHNAMQELADNVAEKIARTLTLKRMYQ